MQSREIKQYNDIKKASESSSHSNEWKKYTTPKARIDHHDRFLKQLPAEPFAKPLVAGILGTMMLTAGMRGTMADQSHALQSLSDSSTGLTPAFPDQRAEIIGKSPTEPYIPTLRPKWLSSPKGPTVEELWPRLHEQMVKVSGEKGEASKNSLQGKAQEIYDGEALSELREQGKPLSSNEKKIATLKAVTEKAGKDPQFATRVRRMLAERQQLSEQKSSEPERRQLNIDSDPTNPICLDVSNSQAETKIEPVNPQDTPVPGTEERVDFFLNVKNRCPVKVDTVAYTVRATVTCPEGSLPPSDTRTTQISAGPSSVGVGENSGMAGSLYMIGRCTTYTDNQPVAINPPESFTATVFADGVVQQETVRSVDSPSYKIL